MRRRCACDRSCRPLQRLSMGLRPFQHCGAYLLRGRSSKIQNNVATMHRNCEDEPAPVLLELQPLARQDAETMATALRRAMDTDGRHCDRRINALARCACPPLFGRGWHLHNCRSGALVVVMGSGRSSGSPLPPLGVHVLDARCKLGRADCKLRRREEYGQPPVFVATCVRFFQYLMPEYAAEFIARVRAHVDARLEVHSVRTYPCPCRSLGWATIVVRQAGDSRQPLLARQKSSGRVGAWGRRCRPLQRLRRRTRQAAPSHRRGSRVGAQAFAFRRKAGDYAL